MIWKDRNYVLPHDPGVMECTMEAQGKVFHLFARGLVEKGSVRAFMHPQFFEEKWFVDGQEVTREEFMWAQEQEWQLEQEDRLNEAIKLCEKAGWSWRKAFDDDKGCELYVLVRGESHRFLTEQEMISLAHNGAGWRP